MFRALGFRVLGFRVQGFRGFKVWEKPDMNHPCKIWWKPLWTPLRVPPSQPSKAFSGSLLDTTFHVC